MISNMNGIVANSVYANKTSKKKKTKKTTNVSKQGDTSKVQKIKKALSNGEYKVDLEMLSELIADELL